MTATPPPSDNLRVVVFGPPGAGKSSLLGALAQAARVQERALRGRLADASGRLGDLCERVYAGPPGQTAEEVVSYPVTFDPHAGSRAAAVLLDCDGRTADRLMGEIGSAKGQLADAVRAADALVLAVDASATAAELDEAFADFADFLDGLIGHRSGATEVAGLPVFLTLTKCDRLAAPADSAADWAARVEDRKRAVAGRFRDFLERETIAFGDVDLRLAATAVRKPELAGGKATDEPVGVAELFRDALQAAAGHRAAVARSQGRLFGAVAVVGGVVAVLLTLAAVLIGLRPYLKAPAAPPTPELVAKIEQFRGREGQTPSTRLVEPLQRKVGELSDFGRDPEFARITPELQDYVRSRLKEYTAYRDYRDRLLAARLPADARNEADLDATAQRLKAELEPPPEYAAGWQQTDASQLRQKWLDDVEALRTGVALAESWYRKLKQEGDALLSVGGRGGPVPWAEWRERADRLLSDEAQRPPFRPNDPLPGSRPVPGQRGAVLTYNAALSFALVEQTRRAWDRTRGRLATLRDIVAALGLAGEPGPLRLPAAEKLTVGQVMDRWHELKRRHPRAAEWTAAGVPAEALPEVRAAAREAEQALLEFGRQLVLRQLAQLAPDGRETRPRWEAVADALANHPDFRDWRELYAVANRLTGAAADDPVMELVRFLKQDRFDLELRGLRLRLPDDIRGRTYRPDGKLTVYLRPGGDKLTEVVFTPEGGERDARRGATVVTFAPDKPAALTYRPGDSLWAELPLRGPDGKEMRFTWAVDPSPLYQFARLARPPMLHRPGEDAAAGEPAEAVTLAVIPDGGLPKVPELFPVVKLTAR